MAAPAAKGELWVERGGSAGPLLLLLHGMGATAAVWDGLRPLLARRWKGRWLAPDLRGHGRSPHRTPYSLGTHAADLAALLEPGEEIFVLGHSMGGAIAMALASGWFGVTVRAVAAFGVKLVWSEAEIAKARELARAPSRLFPTREAAIERYLRVSGLAGLVAPDSVSAVLGIAEAEGGFRLAADPAIAGVAGVEIERVIAARRGKLRLAAGERDPLVRLDEMRRFDPDAVLLPGLGHNPHVEAPEQLWEFAEAALV